MGLEKVSFLNKDKFQIIKASKLVKAEWNYKTNNDELLTKLVENFKRIGQVENIIVRELDTGYYEVVNGNHRLQAIDVLGEKEVMCYNLGKISNNSAKKIAIATNETKFATDTVKLSEILHELTEELSVEQLETFLPYSQQEIEDMLKLKDFDWNSFDENKDSYTESDDSTEIKIKVSENQLKLWKDWKEKVDTKADDEAFVIALLNLKSIKASDLIVD